MTKIVKYIFFFLLFIIFSLVVSTLFIEVRDITGDKMTPTFKPHEKALFRKYLLGSSNPQRSDIVLYAQRGAQDASFIGRVIGLPKEKIMVNNGAIYINDNLRNYQLNEEYLPGVLTKATKENDWINVDDFHYLILLDNREMPVDLQSHLVHKDDIKAVFIRKI